MSKCLLRVKVRRKNVWNEHEKCYKSDCFSAFKNLIYIPRFIRLNAGIFFPLCAAMLLNYGSYIYIIYGKQNQHETGNKPKNATPLLFRLWHTLSCKLKYFKISLRGRRGSKTIPLLDEKLTFFRPPTRNHFYDIAQLHSCSNSQTELLYVISLLA